MEHEHAWRWDIRGAFWYCDCGVDMSPAEALAQLTAAEGSLKLCSDDYDKLKEGWQETKAQLTAERERSARLIRILDATIREEWGGVSTWGALAPFFWDGKKITDDDVEWATAELAADEAGDA